MRFYAACLASYNNGVLHGRWIDASTDEDEMMEEVSAMLRESRFPNVVVSVACNICAGSGAMESHAECPSCKGTGERNVPSAEEWAIHDYEGLPSAFGEYSGLAPIAAFVELVDDAEDDHGMDEDDAIALVNHFGSVEEAVNALRDNFVTKCDSFRDYADEYADEMMATESSASDRRESYASRYFDYESHARDLQMDMTVIELGAGVAIFHA